MKAIGIILSVVMWIIFVLIPVWCTSYIGASDSINLINNNIWLFCGIFLTAVSSGIGWTLICIAFQDWFNSNIKED